MFILAGSAPVRLTDGRFVNRARLFSPKGGSGFQQKHIMTRFEAEKWGIGPSSGLCVFDIGVARIGVAICYDAEFPLIARALAEAGAEILLVPSCTEIARRLSSRAARLRGALPRKPDLRGSHANRRRCALARRACPQCGLRRGPRARRTAGFPANGILAEGALGEPQWVYAALDLDLLADVRKKGDVLNARDWNLQPGAPVLPRAKAVTLPR